MSKRKAIFRTGTSNIVVPGNRESYPHSFQGTSRLHYYSSFFNSLEINSSFYKIPMPATFEKWSKDVPLHFQFSVKLWKEITHVKELNAGTNGIDRFLHAANMLGSKKGCLLVQFPGKIGIEYYNKVEKILDRIIEYDPAKKWRVAVEFRNPSWYTGETLELMDEYNTTVVLHDIPKSRNMEVNKKASFIYIRFHGPIGNYCGSYNKEVLEEWAVRIKAWLAKGKDVYAYFNNTIGSAFENAGSLQDMVNG